MMKNYMNTNFNLTINSLRTPFSGLFLIVIFLLSVSQLRAQTYPTPGNYNYSVPAGVTSINIQAWGGGGAGGGAQNGSTTAGSGGGGGGYSVQNNIAVLPGQIIPFTVGAGGTGANDGAGSAGGATTMFGLTANGGGGGARRGGGGGAGGTASGGATIITGTAGANNGNGGAGANGGAGGNVPGNANGNAGTAPGGGGSGGKNSSNFTFTGRLGGAGGAGRIVITYTLPTLTNFTPNNGCIGTTINLTGTNFIAPLTVTFNGVAATTVNIISPTQIQVGVPTGASNGIIRVITATGFTTNATSFTVNPGPVVPAITGSLSACVSGTTALSNATPGGSWTSLTPAIASVDASGVVTGITSGTATIRYSVTSGGCTGFVDANVTIVALPVLGGASFVCIGSTTQLTPASGGTWISNNPAVATIDNSGNITTVAGGTTTFTFTDTSTNCSATTGTFTVRRTPAITTQPSSRSACTGDSVNIFITASGTTLSYQWYNGATLLVNGGNIAGATSNTLTINPVNLADASSDYHCVVTGACAPPATSNSATLTVTEGVVITAQPAATQTHCINQTATFTVGATGAGVTYQWYNGATQLIDDSRISGATSPTLVITPLLATDASNSYYCMVSGTGPCLPVNSANATLIIDDAPGISSPPVALNTVCDDDPVSLSILATGGSLTYQWFKGAVPMVDGGNISGSNTDTLNFVPVHTSDAATNYYCVVTNSCTSSTSTLAEVVVNLKPKIPTQTTNACSDLPFSVIPVNGMPDVLTIVPAGTTYSWPAPLVTGGMTGGTSQTGQSTITDVLSNTTNTVQTATYSVTPISGTAGNCVGNPFTVIVTVDPVPSILNLTPVVCSGETLTVTPVNGGGSIVPAGTTYSWGAPSVTGGVTGWTIGTSQTSFIQTLNNPTNLPRTATYTVTATSGSCTGSTFIINVTINPKPTVDASPAQVVCSGSAIASIGITNPNNVPGVTTYSWTRDNSANLTGIPASGIGDVISGTLVNNTGAPQNTTFTYYAQSEEGCISNPGVINVIVYPIPMPVATPSTQSLCSGIPFTTVNFTTSNGVVATTYSWTRDNTANLTGLPASGTGSSVSGTLTNNTNIPQSTTFTVTGVADGCSSTTTFTITINPTPTVSATPTAQTVCGNTAFANITASNPNAVAGVTYSWTRNNTVNVTGVAASGTGAVISGTLANNTNVNQTVTFTITASVGTCTSTVATADVTVQPVPILVLSPATQPAICNTGSIATVTLSNSNNVPGTVYNWTRDNSVNITGMPASGTNVTSITGSLTNITTANQTTTFTVTATAPNGCSMVRTIAVIVYPPLTQPTLIDSQTVCAGSRPTPLSMSPSVGGGSGAYIYQWQSSTTSNTGPWANVVGATAATYWPPTTSSATLTTYYQLIVTNPCGTVTSSNAVSVAVANNVNFTFSTSGGGGTVCPNAAFNPTITSGELLPDSYIRYSWTADAAFISPSTGGPIGTTTIWPFPWFPLFAISSATFPLTTINNTTAPITTTIFMTPRIYDADTNAFICALSPRQVTVTILPNAVPTITAPAPGTTICSATSAGVTMTSNIPGTFTITRTGSTNVASSTTFPFTSPAVAAGIPYTFGDVLTNNTAGSLPITYTVRANNSNGCAGAQTTIVINVAPRLLPGTIGSNQTICSGGDPANFTQVTAATGATDYSWELSTVSATGPWTVIPGAIATTYDAPGPITQNTWFRRVASSSVSGVLCSVGVTAPVLVSINVTNPGTIAGNQTICSGGNASITSAAPATGSGTITYQWQSSTVGCAGGWGTIAGTGLTLNVTGITQTTYFRRVGISTVSGSPCQSFSNCITITVNSVTAGIVGSDQVLCGNNPVAFTEPTLATGSGTLSYQWQSNTTGCGGTFANISGATFAAYDAPAGLTQTTYYRRITTSTLNGVQCSATGNCITVVANSVTGGTISGNRTVCSGGDPAAFTQITPATGFGLTYQWQSSTISASGPWSDIALETNATYDAPGPITQTTYFQRVAMATVGATTCQAASNFVTVFVNNVTAPVVAGDQSVCGEDPTAFTVSTAATGSGVLSYQWQSSITGCGGTFANIPLATGATFDPPIVTQTTYYRVIVTSTQNSVGCTAISNCITVTSFAKTWNGSAGSDWNTPVNWTPNGVPTSSHCIVIPNVANYAIISGGSYVGYGRSLTILNGGRLDIDTNNSLVITDDVRVNTGGNFFIEDDASLVQVNNIANTGIVNMSRITQPMYRFDYTYWNSPMTQASNYTLGMLSQNLTQYDKYYSWNPTNAGGNGNWIQESAASVMTPTKGYIVRAPNSFSFNPAITANYTATFTGTPNNGDIQIPIASGTNAASSNDDMNLIGNPYPSAVSAVAFINDPVNVPLVDGTLYFWTHHTPPSTAFPNPFYGNFVLNYSPAGYASYNALGGTYTVPSGYGGSPPNGFIAAGQGFFVKGLGNGNAIFRNNMRITGSNNVFFRPSNPYASAPTTFESHRIWLNMADTQGSFSQILVGYAEGATNEFDRGYDGEMFNSNAISLYSVNSGKALGIQGRALPFEVNDTVQLGYNATVVRSFTIGIDRVDGLFDDQSIYLEDKLLNVIHDIKQSAYTFDTQIGAFNDRFILRYTNSSLGVGNPEQDAGVIAFIKDKKIHISASLDIVEVHVYDISGKLVKTFVPDNANRQFEADFLMSQGVYFAKIKLAGGVMANAKLLNGE